MLPDFLPHLILCDINLKDESDGISLVEKMKSEFAFETIFITSYQSRSVIERALEHQPLNYLMKPVDEAAIFTALKLVWSSLTQNPKLGKPLQPIPFEKLLSPTERKIIQLISLQKTSREIADILFLSPYTVKNHRHSICRKLGLKDGNNALLKWTMQHKEMV